MVIESDRERQAPKTLQEAEVTHLARYTFAAQFLNTGDKVLDMPCGTGYGTFLMGMQGATVVGIDISEGAIQHAQELFSSDQTTYCVGNIEDLHETLQQDEYFDRIVSFEGIEHVHRPESVLSEAHRLLRPGGALIMSTPRKPHGSPYHIVEYTLDEYRSLLEQHFIIQKMYGQIYTDIFDMSIRNEDPYAYQKFNFIAQCIPKK